MSAFCSSSCSDCREKNHFKLGLKTGKWNYIVALAGNPNTGKSTLFNQLTGLRQHTGNWPGKTVARAEGGFSYGDKKFKLIDLPGTYSLLSNSVDEEIARDFSGQKLMRILAALEASQKYLAGNVNPKLVLENLALIF